MFTVDADITDLKIRDRNLIRVLFSMNTHQVATPDTSLEDARTYVFFFNEGKGQISAYIGLHFLQTGRNLFYRHSHNPFNDDRMADAEDEARNFAEDLGAMLDEIDFSAMSAPEKDRWIEDQEILSGRKKTADAAVAAEAPATPAQPGAAQSSAAQPSQSVPGVQPETPPVSGPQAAQARPGDTPPHGVPLQPPVSKPLRKAPPVQAVPPAGASGPDSAQMPPVERSDQVLEQGVKAGIVKAPKAQLKKEIRSTNGFVSRDKEALARLLSSF
jgi:hypothetical protein